MTAYTEMTIPLESSLSVDADLFNSKEYVIVSSATTLKLGYINSSNVKTQLQMDMGISMLNKKYIVLAADPFSSIFFFQTTDTLVWITAFTSSQITAASIVDFK
jgi:hypothetical protein